MLLLCCVAAGAAGGDAGEAPVVGVDSFPHAVANIEDSITYYEEALGAKVVSTVPSIVNGKIAANVYDRELQALMDVGGAYYRIATLRLPGVKEPLRLFELRNNQTIVGLRSERQGRATLTEIGASALRLEIANLDNVHQTLRNKYLGDQLAPDQAPKTGREASTVRDDEGFLIELVRSQNRASGGSPKAGITVTTADLEQKIHFYRDLLGFRFEIGEWSADPAVLAARGATHGRLRGATALVPGTDVVFEILQFADVDQRRFFPAVMGQPGVGWLSFIVRDVDALMASFIKERVRVVSTGLQPVDFSDSRRVAVRDPDGVLLELIELRDAAAAKGSGG